MEATPKDFRGYNDLSPEWQKQFEFTFKRHQAAMGTETRNGLKPVSVSVMKENGRNMLRVTYCDRETKRRQWWHYDRGDWY